MTYARTHTTTVTCKVCRESLLLDRFDPVWAAQLETFIAAHECCGKLTVELRLG